jgi:hypothetical protein
MIIPVELVGVDGVRQRREIATVKLSVDEVRLDDFGLSLEDAKEIQLQLQKEPTQFQTDQAAQRDRSAGSAIALGRFTIADPIRSIRSLAFVVCACHGGDAANADRAQDWAAIAPVPAAPPHNHRTVSNRLAKVADQIEK